MKLVIILNGPTPARLEYPINEPDKFNFPFTMKHVIADNAVIFPGIFIPLSQISFIVVDPGTIEQPSTVPPDAAMPTPGTILQ